MDLYSSKTHAPGVRKPADCGGSPDRQVWPYLFIEDTALN